MIRKNLEIWYNLHLKFLAHAAQQTILFYMIYKDKQIWLRRKIWACRKYHLPSYAHE